MWELLKASFEVLFNAAEYAVSAYVNAFKKFSKYALIIALVSLPLFLLGLLFHSRTLILLFVMVIGLLVIFGLIVSFPALWAAQTAFNRFPSLKRTILSIWGALFWVLTVAIYFYIVPIWQNTEMVPLVLLLISGIIIGSWAFSVKVIPPRMVLLGMVIALIWISRLFFFPETSGWLRSSLGSFDVGLKGWAERHFNAPKRINPESAEWFDFKTGKHLLWYSKDEEGNFTFFDREGYNPNNGLPLKPADRDIFKEWKEWKKNRIVLASPPPPYNPQDSQTNPGPQTQPMPNSADNSGNERPPAAPDNIPSGEQKSASVNNRVDYASEKEVIKLTEDFMRAIERKDLYEILAYYDEPVSYFHRGFQSKQYIKKDLEYFFNNWNFIKYQPVGVVQVNNTISDPGIKDVSYNFDFNVENTKKRITGRVNCILKIKQTASGLKVVGIKQAISNRDVQMVSN